MAWTTIAESREKLGDAYATLPADAVIQSFIDRRKAQIQKITGVTITDPDENIKTWVLDYVCSDVLFRSIIGTDAGSSLSYSIGDLSINKGKNVDTKIQAVQQLQAEAQEALMRYNMQPQYDYGSEESTIFMRSIP